MSKLVRDAYHLHLKYVYELENGESKSFEVEEDLLSEEVKHYSENRYEWAELGSNQCDQCPLTTDKHKYCPAAVSIVDIIEYFSRHVSFTKAKVRVIFEEKEVTAEKPLQDVLFPLVGLRMATSQCPLLAKFKPLARFHEPFATPFYTVFRGTAYYLLRRYIENQRDGTSNWSLDGLKDFYEDIGVVNEKMAERLVDAKVMDATPNSIVILSMFSTSMTFFYDEYLRVFEKLFDAGPSTGKQNHGEPETEP